MNNNDEKVMMNLALWTATQQLVTRYDMERLKGRSPAEAGQIALSHLRMLEATLPQAARGGEFVESCRLVLQTAQQFDEVPQLPLEGGPPLN